MTVAAQQPPSAYLVINYLKEIAKAANIAWEPTDLLLSEEEMEARAAPVPNGFSIPMAPGSQLSSVYQRAGRATSEGVVASPQSECQRHHAQVQTCTRSSDVCALPINKRT
jgi:hypothetical protein